MPQYHVADDANARQLFTSENGTSTLVSSAAKHVSGEKKFLVNAESTSC